MFKQSDWHPFIFIKEAAIIADVCIGTMRRWARTGIIRSYRVGRFGDFRFLKHELIEDLERMQFDGKKYKWVRIERNIPDISFKKIGDISLKDKLLRDIKKVVYEVNWTTFRINLNDWGWSKE